MRFAAFLISLLAVSGTALAHHGTGAAHSLSHALAGDPGLAADIVAMIALGLVAVGAVLAIRWAVSGRASRDR